jgi:uncharacterized protein
LSLSQDQPGFAPFIEPPQAPTQPTPSIAPVWHTVLLLLFVIGISATGAYRYSGAAGPVRVHRIPTYAMTAVAELALVGWVAFGLRLRRIPLRSLFGSMRSGIGSIALDALIAVAFWICSMSALGTVAVFWMGIETAITHRPLPIHSGKVFVPDPSQEHAMRAVLQLAPSNGKEIACWVLLCMWIGVAEELVFRGYLQRQFTAWARGAAAAGVVFSAITFGAAHGYEGARSMFLLAIFGGLFSLLALFRRNLRAGIFAHTWHDVFAGLMISFLHARHIL